MQPNTLPPGYISIDEAVEIIKSDTRDNPVVDIQYAKSKERWIDTNKGFRIPRIRKLAQDEIYRDNRGKPVYFETVGEINVFVNTNFEKELLLKTINDKWYELTGKEYDTLKTRGVSTVADDAQGESAVRPRSNTPMTKEGESIAGGGQTVTTNGENITV